MEDPVWPMVWAMLRGDERVSDVEAPSGSDALLFVTVTVTAHLSQAATFQVFNDSEEPVYGCPVCLFSTTDCEEFAEHRVKWRHAIAVCALCNGVDEHIYEGCHGGFIGFLWDKSDFIVPHSEFALPAIRQYHCPVCSLTYASAESFLMHCSQTHDVPPHQVCVRPLRGLPRRYFSRSDEAMSVVLVPRERGHGRRRRRKHGRLLYQCPECRYIFSSWSQWEGHVRVTKHSQPYCPDCGKMLGKFTTDEGDHMTQMNHTRLIGTQPTKETHLCLFDTSMPRLQDIVDHADANEVDPDDHLISAFQCPEESCGLIFLSFIELSHHCTARGHGVVTCALCHETLRVIDNGVLADHPHTIPNLPPAMWPLRFPGETCEVSVLESDLAAWLPALYCRCAMCHATIYRSTADAHVDSDECRRSCECRAAQRGLLGKTRPVKKHA